MSASKGTQDLARVIKIPAEDHTLGTTLTTALWANPHVTVAQYAQKHPVERDEISVHCQTDGAVTATASLEQAVQLTKHMLSGLDTKMTSALETWEALPEAEKRALNRQGMRTLEALMEEAMEDLRHNRIGGEGGDEGGDGGGDEGGDQDNPFRKIVREAQRRRQGNSY